MSTDRMNQKRFEQLAAFACGASKPWIYELAAETHRAREAENNLAAQVANWESKEVQRASCCDENEQRAKRMEEALRLMLAEMRLLLEDIRYEVDLDEDDSDRRAEAMEKARAALSTPSLSGNSDDPPDKCLKNQATPSPTGEPPRRTVKERIDELANDYGVICECGHRKGMHWHGESGAKDCAAKDESCQCKAFAPKGPTK